MDCSLKHFAGVENAIADVRSGVGSITTPTDKHCRSRHCRPVTDHEDRYDELIEKLIRNGRLS